MLQQIKERLAVYGLKVNETKTKIVYCKRENRDEDYDSVSFKITSKYKAIAMLKRKQQLCPKLFAHWQAGFNV